MSKEPTNDIYKDLYLLQRVIGGETYIVLAIEHRCSATAIRDKTRTALECCVAFAKGLPVKRTGVSLATLDGVCKWVPRRLRSNQTTIAKLIALYEIHLNNQLIQETC